MNTFFVFFCVVLDAVFNSGEDFKYGFKVIINRKWSLHNLSTNLAERVGEAHGNI